ncbi:unnamed protein product (macronuclear) [Paramecium tetraurelia]|uniref:Transmembrane protein n=1 Tax=Paramecium tetraurelia TaxID=5888 RepID=A0DWH2_PARTE|nr:uncharacterized protein GSPATT00021031001 [Paramecium tetraurelia]CAK87389.1 unnamed protein product [Paramecium tetraurelia]|eukprot:XP_001454786.1 hypothetical protein (macronuclear) [Paramecium tetraurelia strain d4-2]
MINQQPNQEIEDLDSDDVDIIFRRIKIIFFFSLLQLIVSGGLMYLHLGFINYMIVDGIGIPFQVNQRMFWSYDQNRKTIQAQQQHTETTNNFLTRFQLVFSVTLTTVFIYEFMGFLLITIQEQAMKDLFIFLIIIGFSIQILIQIVILITNSYFCKSPNVLRLSIYFQSLTLSLVIFLSWVKIYQVQELPSQIQTADYWIEWNTLLQIPTLLFLAISMLFNYMGNKKAYNILGTVFLLLSILHTVFGCLVIRNGQFWVPTNDQLALRALHNDVIEDMGCSKYINNEQCPLVYQVEAWEYNNELKCLSSICEDKAINYIKNLNLLLGLVFLFEASLLFMNTYAMYTVSVKYQISKLLNPLTQKIVISLFFLTTIVGIVCLESIPLPKIQTQPSMDHSIESDMLPEFNQVNFNQIANSFNLQDCQTINQLQTINEFQAINCDTSCEQYEFIVALTSENSLFKQLEPNSVKTFNQEFTNQYFNKKDIHQQLVIKGDKNSVIQGLNNIQVCSDNSQIQMDVQVEQVKQQKIRLLQKLKFMDILSNRIIQKGTFRVYKEFIQCAHIKDQPYFEQSIDDENIIYNIKKGSYITIVFQNEKYFDYCGNFLISEEKLTINPYKLNNNKFTIIVKWQNEQETPVYLIANQKIGKNVSCQVGGYFTGCGHIKSKQNKNYSLLQFQEYINNAIIFLQDYEVDNQNSLSLSINIYFNGVSNTRYILCIDNHGNFKIVQEIDNNNLYPKTC